MRVCAELPTGYFSSGSMTRASPKMVLQYSAILACCLALAEEGTRHWESPETPTAPAQATYESTWFSKERMTGYGEVLKALSAMASITSCRTHTSKHFGLNIKANGADKH